MNGVKRLRRVFIYGTLRHAQRNAHQMQGARYVGMQRSAPAFTLYDLGTYPAAVAGGSTRLLGEVHVVAPELLVRLDAFEGVPELYRRERVRMAYGEAWIYVMKHVPRHARPIPHGDWVHWRGRAAEAGA